MKRVSKIIVAIMATATIITGCSSTETESKKEDKLESLNLPKAEFTIDESDQCNSGLIKDTNDIDEVMESLEPLVNEVKIKKEGFIEDKRILGARGRALQLMDLKGLNAAEYDNSIETYANQYQDSITKSIDKFKADKYEEGVSDLSHAVEYLNMLCTSFDKVVQSDKRHTCK